MVSPELPISRNASSLPDFPEFAQAVRYGVPGTLSPELIKQLGMVSPELMNSHFHGFRVPRSGMIG